MVRKSFSTSSSIKGSHKLFRFFFLLILLGASASILVFFILQFSISGEDSNPSSSTEDSNSLPADTKTDEHTDATSSHTSENDSPVYPSIDFSPAINNFVDSTSGTKSILVYDLEKQEILNEVNPTEKYSTASLYKLFVVYEGYRRLDNGSWNQNDPVGTTGHTVLECLDLAIRESNSLCAEGLWNMIGHSALDEIITSECKIVNTDISHLISTPNDILSIMKLFYEHPHITDSTLIARIKDSFLNQPKTEYDWRQGLPSGFQKANVYNKVGWDYNPEGEYWNIYHDAAIIEYPEDNRHFVVIVMTTRVPFSKITKFGTEFEDIYLKSQSNE